MTPETFIHIPPRLHALVATALLLERLERTPRSASPAQYQGLVRQLDRLLDEAQADADEPALEVLLEGLPVLAERHENRHYVDAGLCRSPLEAAIAAGCATHALLARMRGAA